MIKKDGSVHMKAAAILVLIASTFGCNSTKPEKAGISQRLPEPEHFVPAPPMPVPRTMTAEEMSGMASGAVFSSPVAQTFKASLDGYLSEIDLGMQGSRDRKEYPQPEAPVVEIRSTQDGLPRSDPDSLKYRAAVPYSSLPPAGRAEGGMIRIDLSTQHIPVSEGELLAVVLLYGTNSHVQFQTVNGNVYGDGDVYQLQEGEWKAMPSFGDFQFRVYGNEQSVGPATSIVSVSEPAPSAHLIASTATHPEMLMAQCLPKARSPVTQPAFIERGKWQFRAHVFMNEGCYYLEYIVYNGTNRASSPPETSGRPQTITVMRSGESIGRVVYPPRQPNYFFDGMGRGSGYLNSGEGSVHEYKLSDADHPLPSGQYLVLIVTPASENNESVSALFSVPSP